MVRPVGSLCSPVGVRRIAEIAGQAEMDGVNKVANRCISASGTDCLKFEARNELAGGHCVAAFIEAPGAGAIGRRRHLQRGAWRADLQRHHICPLAAAVCELPKHGLPRSRNHLLEEAAGHVAVDLGELAALMGGRVGA